MKVFLALIIGIIIGFTWCYKVNVEPYEFTQAWEDGSFVGCYKGGTCND